jgi:hypothetical protein
MEIIYTIKRKNDFSAYIKYAPTKKIANEMKKSIEETWNCKCTIKKNTVSEITPQLLCDCLNGISHRYFK